MRIIKGATVEEQIASIDAYLHRTRGHLISKQMHSLLYPHGISAYATETKAEEEFGHAMAPMAGKFTKIILQVDEIPRVPTDLRDSAAVISVLIEVDGSNWIEVNIPTVAKKRVQVSAQSLEIGEGTRFKFSANRVVHGAWICCVLEPKPYPILVELPDAGI